MLHAPSWRGAAPRALAVASVLREHPSDDKLDIAEHDGKQVIEIMRDPAGKLPHGLHLLSASPAILIILSFLPSAGLAAGEFTVYKRWRSCPLPLLGSSRLAYPLWLSPRIVAQYRQARRQPGPHRVRPEPGQAGKSQALHLVRASAASPFRQPRSVATTLRGWGHSARRAGRAMRRSCAGPGAWNCAAPGAQNTGIRGRLPA